MDYEISNRQPVIDVLNSDMFIVYADQELGVITERGNGYVKWMDQGGQKWTCYDMSQIKPAGKNYIRLNIGMNLRAYSLYHNYIKER